MHSMGRLHPRMKTEGRAGLTLACVDMHVMDSGPASRKRGRAEQEECGNNDKELGNAGTACITYTETLERHPQTSCENQGNLRPNAWTMDPTRQPCPAVFIIYGQVGRRRLQLASGAGTRRHGKEGKTIKAANKRRGERAILSSSGPDEPSRLNATQEYK